MMHRESCMCGMENLELFQVPPTNIAIAESKWMEYYPISSTLESDTAPIEFDIQGQGDEYIDLSQTYIQVICKFTKADGGNLTGANTDSTPVNKILDSLFTEIDVTLNGKIISPGTDTYPYKAYLEKILSYRPETLGTQMKACSLWEKDTAGHMDDCKNGDPTQVKSKFDVAEANGVKSVTVRESDLTAKNPLRRVDVKTFTIPTGTQSKISDHLYQGQMPKRIVLGLVGNDAFNGTADKNPFHFKNAKVKKLEVSINGETISTRPFEPDFTNDLYLRSYLSLYQGLGKFGADWAPDITFDEYKNGYTLWCIDFTKDQEAQLDKFHLIETGNLRIEIQFAVNTTETLNCLVYAEFDNLLEINKQREVSIDF
ncbi:uncharacterized protein F54H12.2-like [Magallana gigas]|uniref:uncharacterized protein F54H12.2-like n=1 Tax=Magallana gigas TaxID=29159 RepID=UPI00333FD8A8